MRLLAVDIGNSSVKCGTFDGAEAGRVTSRQHEGSKSVVVGMVLSEVKGAGPEAVLVSGVVPGLVDNLMARIKGEGVEAARFREDFAPLVEVATATPDSTGDDRVAAASAAFAEVRGAAIVVNAGTAITVDAIAATGVFLGGAILPGPSIALEALRANTALLPPVRLVAPISTIGQDTVQAMLSGCVAGIAGAADRLVGDMRMEMGEPNCAVLLTGGASDMLYEHLRTACRREPALVLQGLVLSYLGTK